MVAYCSDLGYGAARGAQMLSLMLGCGIVSRLVFGVISDRIGGLRTLLVGAGLQGLSLLLFLPFDGLVSLYLISALFGLFQGGIVPAYAIIVREYFSPTEAGARVGAVLMATLLGMALGGWMSGALFDLAGSYKAAFANGILWNLVTLSIAGWLLRRHLRRTRGDRARWRVARVERSETRGDVPIAGSAPGFRLRSTRATASAHAGCGSRPRAPSPRARSASPSRGTSWWPPSGAVAPSRVSESRVCRRHSPAWQCAASGHMPSCVASFSAST